MKIKLIDFGGRVPERAHYNDAGADVFARTSVCLPAHSITKVPLGFGLELPDGLVAFIVPRSGMSTKNQLTCELVPIDSGYRGEIHAIIYNASEMEQQVEPGLKIAQLVILPAVLAEFDTNLGKARGLDAFGSTDRK